MKARTPNNIEGLAAQSDATNQSEYITSHNGALNVNVNVSGSTIPVIGVSQAQAVAVVDGSGNQISSFGGGTQYTDGGVTPAHPVGTMPVWDKSGAISETSLANGLPVQPATGASFGSSSADGSTFTQNSTTGGVSMGVYVASPQTLTTGKAGAIAVDVNRNTLVANSGTFAVQAAQNTASNLKTESHLYDSSTNGIGSTGNALDVNIKSGNPTTITATQSTATSLKTQAEAYQGGSAVSSSNPLNVSQLPATAGGYLVASGTIGNAATAVKASAGQVYGWYFYNSNTTVAYVQFYNTTTGNTSVGTNVIASLGVPPGVGANVFLPVGWAFSTAITIAICTTRAGSTSPTNTVDYNVFYA